MNSDQIGSLIRSLLKTAGAALAAHGMTKAGNFLNAEDVIGIIIASVGFVASHKWHADDTTSGGTLAGTVTKVGVIALAAGMLSGCASFNANVFNTENIIADAATQATHTFNVYYQAATNGASPDAVAKLDAARDTIYARDQELAKSLGVVEGLRLAYVANSADTNKTVLQIALETAINQSSNIVWTVQNFSVHN